MDVHRLAACAGCGRQFDLTADPDRDRLAAGDRFRCSCGEEVTVPAARSESAAIVACSSCGGPRQGNQPACGWCGAGFTLHELDLDAICPRCAARVSRRGRFCHHCALPLTAPDEPVPTDYACPACATAANRGVTEEARPLLASRRVGEGDPLHLFECPRCAGLWLDRDVFQALVERARRGRSGLPLRRTEAPAARAAAPGGSPGDRAYRPCPVCAALMNRRNYARRSGVVLDLCARHGVWFDREELAGVLDWVRRGGGTEAEVPKPEPARRSAPLAGAEWGGLEGSPWGRSYDLGALLAGVAATLGRSLFRRG